MAAVAVRDSPGSILLGWVARCATRKTIVSADAPGASRSAIVGALLLGGGMGIGGLGRADDPVGDRRAARRDDAGLGRGLRARCSSANGCRGSPSIGIVVGFVGVAILVGPTALGARARSTRPGIVVDHPRPIAWSIGSLFATHRAELPRHPLVATGLQMVSGAARPRDDVAIVSGEPARFDPAAVSRPSVAAFVYLTIVGSIVAFTTFGWMLRVAPLPLVATYAYVNPVVAVILGAIVLGEPIEPRTVLAGGDHRRAGRADRRPPAAAWRARSRPPTLRLRQHRPGNPSRQRHHGQHRVDADGGREERARPPRRGRRPVARVGRAIGRGRLGSHGWSRGAAPIRTVPIWCAENTEPRFGRKSIRATRSSKRPYAAASLSGDERIAVNGSPAWRRRRCRRPRRPARDEPSGPPRGAASRPRSRRDGSRSGRVRRGSATRVLTRRPSSRRSAARDSEPRASTARAHRCPPTAARAPADRGVPEPTR